MGSVLGRCTEGVILDINQAGLGGEGEAEVAFAFAHGSI